jgi:hypothetical protein
MALGDPGSRDHRLLWLAHAPHIPYRQLNQAKVKVLMQLEADLPSQPFAREHDIYRSEKRKSLSWIEALIPVGFGFVYLVMFLVAVFPPAVTFFNAMENSGEGSPVPCFFPCLRI